MGSITDMTDKRFGRLTVIKMLTERSSGGSVMWECKCDCGNTYNAIGSTLRTGECKSCGCIVLERMSKLSSQLAPDEVGNTYGKLTVLERVVKSREQYSYRCKCTCGRECVVRGVALRDGSRKSCGAWECRDEIVSAVSEQVDEFDTQTAYLAGHFDGEGCVSFQRAKSTYLPGITIRVSVCYKPTLEVYLRKFGGTLNPVKTRLANHRQMWIWQLVAQHQVIRFINHILPFSTEKNDQLQLAKDYLLWRIQRPKYNAGDEVWEKVPELVDKMSRMKQFEFSVRTGDTVSCGPCCPVTQQNN